MSLNEAIARRYPYSSEGGAAIREGVLDLCTRHLEAGLADDNAEKRLCSDDLADFWQQLSEILLAEQLRKAGLSIDHSAEGPDFLIEREERRLWIEVIAPEPRGLPDFWTNHVSGNVVSLPHEELLLRWTAAIKEKAEKLLGRRDRKSGKWKPGYLERGVVSENDTYVIAVNSRLLRGFGGAFPELYGISQFPFAVEATLAVGPLQIRFDRQTLEQVGAGHQHRTWIRKPVGEAVPADTFLDPRFSPISAVWAVDVDELLVLGEARPMVVVHNPRAANPLPKRVLPAQSEYFAEEGDDLYEICRKDGVLAG